MSAFWSRCKHDLKVIVLSAGTEYFVVTTGMGGRALLQAVVVVFLARMLGKTEYGVYVTIISVTGFFSVLAGLGASALHLRDVSLDPQGWRRSYAVHHRVIYRSQWILVPICALVAWLIVSSQVTWLQVALIVTGDILGLPATDLLVRSFQGRERYGLMAAAMCALSAVRVAILALLAFVGLAVTLEIWALASFVSGLILFSVGALVALRTRSDTVDEIGSVAGGRLTGLGFALASASTRIHADADKAIIARLSSFGVAGEYSLAYRMVDVLLLPINGLVEWSTRSLFRCGAGEDGAGVMHLWRRWLLLLIMALLASGALWSVSPWLPWLFGHAYEGSVVMGRWLSLLPLTTAIWMVIRSVAATSGHEKTVGLVELAGAGMSVASGIVLVMLYNWRGAVIATYIVQIAMTIAVPVLSHWMGGRSLRGGKVVVP